MQWATISFRAQEVQCGGRTRQVVLYFGQIKRTNNHLVHTVHLRSLNADVVNDVMNMLEVF